MTKVFSQSDMMSWLKQAAGIESGRAKRQGRREVRLYLRVSEKPPVPWWVLAGTLVALGLGLYYLLRG